MTQEPPDASEPTETPPAAGTPSREGLVLEARNHLTELLGQQGIGTVVYVDDKNTAAKESDIQVDLVIAAISSTKLSPDIIRASEALAHLLDSDQDETAVERLLDRLQLEPPNLSNEELTSLTDAARAIRQGEPAEVTGEGDIVTTDVDALHELRELISIEDYRAINLAEWTMAKSTVLATTTPTVLLFDRDFSDEGASTVEGDKLLLEAVSRNNKNLVCGLLTHGATSDDRETALVEEIVSTSGADPVDLVVISKQSVNEDPGALPRKLKAAFLNGPLKALRDAVVEGYQSASASAVSELQRLNAHTIAGLIQTADSEGIHGAENLLRVASRHSRLEVSRSVRLSPPVVDALSRTRALNRLGPQGNQLPHTDVSELKRRDRYDDAAFLSDLHLPLEPGDIFERCSPADLLAGTEPPPGGRRYVLLVQACDTMLRSTGVRLDDPRTLTLARLKKVRVDSPARPYDHALDWYDPEALQEGTVWRVQSISRVQIPTVALDACVLSQNGAAVLTVGPPAPECMPLGWERRHEKLQAWAQSVLESFEALNETAPLSGNYKLRKAVIESLTGTPSLTSEVGCDLDLPNKRLSYGLRRIGRVSEGDARVILANAGHYIARPATDGDLLPGDPVSI